jgi:hypothetical protein
MVATAQKSLFVVKRADVAQPVRGLDVPEQGVRRVVLPWGFTRRTRDAVDRIVTRATDRLVMEMTIEEDWTP